MVARQIQREVARRVAQRPASSAASRKDPRLREHYGEGLVVVVNPETKTISP